MTLQIPIKHKSKGTNIMYIDEEDLDKIKDLNLTLNYTSNKHTYYAKHIVYQNQKYIKTINIHRLIMGLGDFKEDKRIINHIDGNGLNNCKSNLEICNHQYNGQRINIINKDIKNYYFENDDKRKCKWRTTFKINGKFHTKRFMTEKECIEYVNYKINNLREENKKINNI